MKRRIELSVLLYCIEHVRPDEVCDKKLDLKEGGQKILRVEQLLVIARAAAHDIKSIGRFREVAQGQSIATFLTRECEQFSGWRNPLKSGQGKNIDEFFRVLYRAEKGDEMGGYLLTREGKGRECAFRVFPGQLMLKTLIYFAAEAKQLNREQGGAGKLVLQDVEDRFAQYGIDFSCAADARPLMMSELRAMGLLSGSPDAGSSVAVARPY